MKEISLKANTREEIGKEAVKKLRQQGLIPAVVYKGKNSLNIKILSKEFLAIIHTKAGENVIVNLDVEGLKGSPSKDKKVQGESKRSAKTAIIKEIQYHPVRGDVLHVDFNEISLTEAITVKVPITAKGQPQGIKESGVLEYVLREVEVECLPTQIPETIYVDVSALKIGDSILVGDLHLPEGVKILSDAQATVITVALPHVEEAVEAVPTEEMAEPEVIMEKKPKEEEEETPTEEAKEK